ncbi:hypothetical protein SESBI_47953 [Sesbania bispinosa]|nr:hypothetical protein SESBI_47953 [Sesbania bispinosa]
MPKKGEKLRGEEEGVDNDDAGRDCATRDDAARDGVVIERRMRKRDGGEKEENEE